MASMDCATLDDLILTIEELFLVFVDSEETAELKYNAESELDPVLVSQENVDAIDLATYGALSATPESFSSLMTLIIEDLIARRNRAFDRNDWSDYLPELYLSGLLRYMDFFNEHYAAKVAYSDEYQYFQPEVSNQSDENTSSAFVFFSQIPD